MSSNLVTAAVLAGAVVVGGDYERTLDRPPTVRVPNEVDPWFTEALLSFKRAQALPGELHSFTACYEALRLRWVARVGAGVRPDAKAVPFPAAMDYEDLAIICRAYLAAILSWSEGRGDGTMLNGSAAIAGFEQMGAPFRNRNHSLADAVAPVEVFAHLDQVREGRSSNEDTATVFRALGAACVAADLEGIHDTGGFNDYSEWDALKDTPAAVLRKVASTAGDLAGELALGLVDVAARVATSPLGAAAILGYVAWRYS